MSYDRTYKHIFRSMLWLEYYSLDLIEEMLDRGLDETGTTIFICNSCVYSSKKKYNVQEHIKVKHLPVQVLVTCPECLQTFHSKSSLRSHKWRFHREVSKELETSNVKF